MGSVCVKNKESDPNAVDEDVNEKESEVKEEGVKAEEKEEEQTEEGAEEDHYYLSNEVKKGVIVVYIDSTCKVCNCSRVLELFSSINLKPIVVDISKDVKPKKMLRTLKKLTKDPKPPFVFITGKYYGRLNEIDAGIKNHTVQKIVNEWLNTRPFGSN